MIALDKIVIGSDIMPSFSIYTDDTKTTRYNLDDFLEIIVYLYTKTTDVKKFSKTVKTGYTRLVRVDAYTYKAILEGALSGGMAAGLLRIEIFTATTAAEISTGRLKAMGYADLCELVLRPITTEQ